MFTRFLYYHHWIMVMQSGTHILKRTYQSLRCYNTGRGILLLINLGISASILHNASITKILTDLHWPPLESDRKQARLILLYKTVNGYLTVPARCLPPPPMITYTRANHTLHIFNQIWIYTDTLSYPEQSHNGMTCNL